MLAELAAAHADFSGVEIILTNSGDFLKAAWQYPTSLLSKRPFKITLRRKRKTSGPRSLGRTAIIYNSSSPLNISTKTSSS